MAGFGLAKYVKRVLYFGYNPKYQKVSMGFIWWWYIFFISMESPRKPLNFQDNFVDVCLSDLSPQPLSLKTWFFCVPETAQFLQTSFVSSLISEIRACIGLHGSKWPWRLQVLRKIGLGGIIYDLLFFLLKYQNNKQKDLWSL